MNENERKLLIALGTDKARNPAEQLYKSEWVALVAAVEADRAKADANKGHPGLVEFNRAEPEDDDLPKAQGCEACGKTMPPVGGVIWFASPGPNMLFCSPDCHRTYEEDVRNRCLTSTEPEVPEDDQCFLTRGIYRCRNKRVRGRSDCHSDDASVCDFLTAEPDEPEVPSEGGVPDEERCWKFDEQRRRCVRRLVPPNAYCSGDCDFAAAVPSEGGVKDDWSNEAIEQLATAITDSLPDGVFQRLCGMQRQLACHEATEAELRGKLKAAENRIEAYEKAGYV